MRKLRAAGICLLAATTLVSAVGCSTETKLTKDEEASIKGRPMPPDAAKKMADFQKEWAKNHPAPMAGPPGGAPAGPPGGR